MREEKLIKNLNLPLNYVPKYKTVSFFNLPKTIQRRIIEIVPTPQVITLRQTCSELVEETEKIQGDYPVDRFEARILPISSPIPYNRLRYKRNANQVEYIADPSKPTFDPNMLELLNIRSELGLFNLATDTLHDILERIDITKVSKVDIKGNIELDDFRFIMSKPFVRNISFEGCINSEYKFKVLLSLLTNCKYIYMDVRVPNQENFEKLLVQWVQTRAPPVFFYMMIHAPNQSAEAYNLDIFDIKFRSSNITSPSNSLISTISNVSG